MNESIEKELVLTDSDEDFDFTARKKHGKQALRIVESDSEVENDSHLNQQGESNQIIDNHAKQILRIVESDSETENDLRRNESEKANKVVGRKISEQETSDESKESSDDDKNISSSVRRKKKRRNKSNDHQAADEHMSKINALCDESSSDESGKEVNTVIEVNKKRAPQRMSAKQAEEQMKVIQSESQRLARECRLSVPYHKPKQHSLKDFLNRRTINRPIPMALTKKAAATIKMSKEELEQYAKSLEDRNKESQEFYRSDSDDSINDEKQNSSKYPIENLECNEEEKVEQECINLFPEPTEAINIVAELAPVAISDCNNLSEATNLIEPAEVISFITESTEDANSAVAEDNNVDAELRDEIIPGISTVSLVTSALHEINEDELQNSTSDNRNKEAIEIDYEFGENEGKSSKKTFPLFSSVKPCLKGPVNGVIHLDNDEIESSKTGGYQLLERFIKHVAKKPTRSAKEVSILSTDNGVVEIKNLTIESDDQSCIHSKPRKDCFQLKEELSLRIAAKRKEELIKKQMLLKEMPNEESDSDFENETSKSKEIESCSEVNGGNTEINQNYESDDEVKSVNENDNDSRKGSIHENGDAVEITDEDCTEDKCDDDEEEVEDEDKDDDEDKDEGEDKDDQDCVSNHSNELINEKPKRRKRIVVMDSSDDDDDQHLSSDEKYESLNKTINLDSSSISLEEAHIFQNHHIEKTVSQISRNQSFADQLIDSCSKIVPEPNESENHLSALFTQTEGNISESDLLDLCSGSFVTQATNPNYVETNFETQVDSIADNDFSDDDIGLPNKSRQRKIINISDDENDDNEVHKDTSNASNDDAFESDVVDENISDEEAEERIVEYDSEENEIEVPLVEKKKISDFFENEAELSESEWGSADEDEKNMDKFEIELGDEDEFDQNQLISELDKIHRRRMLDQDAREVKIIKDTHFEDEEESGIGRHRQYKWKHMENSLTIDENQITDNGDTNGKSDDENEETWRRMRHERNNILQETKNQNDSANETKLITTVKTKKRISIVKTSANMNTSATKDLPFLISKMKEEQAHRSSLLIRDAQTLANLAKMTTDDSIPSVNTNSKNFLFNVITPDEEKPTGKRKLDDGGIESEIKSRKTTKRIKKSTLSVLDKLL